MELPSPLAEIHLYNAGDNLKYGKYFCWTLCNTTRITNRIYIQTWTSFATKTEIARALGESNWLT